MTSFMERIFHRQAPIPSTQATGYLRHQYQCTWLPPNSLSPSLSLLDCPSRYDKTAHRPQGSMFSGRLWNPSLICAAIFRRRDRAHTGSRLLERFNITSKDLSPVKNRSSHSRSRNQQVAFAPINDRVHRKIPSAQGHASQLRCDPTKRRHQLVGSPFHQDLDPSPSLQVTVGLLLACSTVADLLFCSHCRSHYTVLRLWSTALSPSLNRLSDPLYASSSMENQDQTNAQDPANTPTERFFNRECTMCKTHSILINSFVKHLKDYETDSRAKRKKLEKQKEEIENLKGRCSHLEEAIDQIKALSQNYQAEASFKASARRDPTPEDSVMQNFP